MPRESTQMYVKLSCVILDPNTRHQVYVQATTNSQSTRKHIINVFIPLIIIDGVIDIRFGYLSWLE